MINKKSIIVSVALFLAGLSAWFLFWDNSQSEPIRGNAIVSISVPKLPEAFLSGKKIFDTNCSSCHGENAAGAHDTGPPLVHIIYEPNHHSDGSFVLAAKNGVRSHHWPYGNMPPVDGIKDTEISEIIKYVRFLQRANGIGNSK